MSERTDKPVSCLSDARGSRQVAFTPSRRVGAHAVALGVALVAVTAGCPVSPGVSVVDVDDRGVLETSPMIRGRDGGYSALVEGRSIWAHGDTILAEEGEHGAWLNSSVSWTDDLDASDGLTGFEQAVDAAGVVAPFFTPTDAVVWAGAIVADPFRGGALVAWIRLAGEDGSAEEERTGFAHWAGPGTAPTMLNDGEGLFGPDVRVNSALLADGDWLYGFGCKSEGLAKPCTLARVSFSDVDVVDEWRFWDGGGWSDDAGSAVPVFEAHDIVSVHYSTIGEKYIAVYSEPLGTGVFVRTAPTMTGPWSAPETLFEAEESDDGALPYSAVAHEEYAYATDDGWTEVITYHRGTEPFQSDFRVVHVTLEATP